jgi:hypothetical protein
MQLQVSHCLNVVLVPASLSGQMQQGESLSNRGQGRRDMLASKVLCWENTSFDETLLIQGASQINVAIRVVTEEILGVWFRGHWSCGGQENENTGQQRRTWACEPPG